ncbi:LCP family protein [Amnibacterium kyonggiense]|uniref:LytR family transcriptional attenuator n=1 Tax=Amnibacterium kyonggiense TaxID=595671 RepID=A0A4R7FPP6_9MICO|nr:LCP family protein [Amnibacterium kyonggiense]TDS79683.1 LytR family transcriptional attenuator [Amnibacterium kyonggiense]
MAARARATLARHGRLRSPGLVGSVLRFLAIGLCVVLVAGVSVGAIAYERLVKNLGNHTVTLPGDDPTDIPAIGAYSGTVNLLLVGSDTRNGQKGHYGENPGSTLNDVNILVHISADHTKATVISFPRDLYVSRPECTDPTDTARKLPAATGVKINSTLEYGGLGCVRDTVAALTGMSIPFAALITFDGVVEMSNAVGGVPVCVASAINDDYTGLHLAKGEHTIQGVTALKFLRTRHGVGDGSDLTRISSQQVFLSSLVRKIKSNATLTDVTKLYGLATAATQSMTLSSGLANVDTMVSIGRAVAGIPLGQFVLVQYPTTLYGDGLVPNDTSATVLLNAVKADKTLKLAKKQKGATDGSGSVEASPSTSSSPTSSPTSSPSPSGSSDTVDLPDTVVGQSVDQQTCSVGNDLGRR